MPSATRSGLAASLGPWEARQFSAFLAWHDAGRGGGPLLPLRLNHEAAWLTPRGMETATVGVCLQFASAPASRGFPGGLLVLACLDPAHAPGILAAMRGRGEWMCMSVGGVEDGFRGERGDLWLSEVSLVDKIGNQADPDALVVSYGRSAVTAFELLTGERPPYDLLRSVG